MDAGVPMSQEQIGKLTMLVQVGLNRTGTGCEHENQCPRVCRCAVECPCRTGGVCYVEVARDLEDRANNEWVVSMNKAERDHVKAAKLHDMYINDAGKAVVITVRRCSNHPAYDPVEEPTTTCAACWQLYFGISDTCVNCGCQCEGDD